MFCVSMKNCASRLRRWSRWARSANLRKAPIILEWDRYNRYNLSAEHFDLLEASKFARMSAPLAEFMTAHGLGKPSGDALTALKQLNKTIHDSFNYVQGVTEVHSPIDDALKAKSGVCQDFAHNDDRDRAALGRAWRVMSPAISIIARKVRTVPETTPRMHGSKPISPAWDGSDSTPTNDILAGERHLRVAVGRDYADVPPTRGTFKGGAETELAISVSVQPTQAPARHEEFLRVARAIKSVADAQGNAERLYQQQQQQ